LASYLAGEGIERGDHVGVLLPNSLAAVCCVFALARLGAVLVPINTRLTAAEVSWQLKRADCARLVYAGKTEITAREAAGNLPQGRVRPHCLPDDPVAFEARLATLPVIDRPSPATFDALQAVVFTSGTTGHPKGAMITYANHFWSAVGSAFRLGVRPDDRWLACLPLYHVGGLAVLFRSCLYGTAIILHDGFDARTVLNSLATEEITLISVVPTMLARLLGEGLTAETAPALRLALLGGAAASPELLTEAAEAGIPVAVTYGLTEAASQVATMLPDPARAKPGSAGRPLLFTSLAVIGEDGREAQTGEAGEIIVSGPTVMSGYYADPEATGGVLRGGRLHTGDIGLLDESGDLWVLDRRSDLIVSGGENIYPAEVEHVLREHPAVAEACVVGLPHPVWGRQVAAMIAPQAPGLIDESALLAHCRERLAGYKQPRLLVIAEQLPHTASGKIHRRAVVEQLSALVEPA
jgi:O-succinylbenzoic acid--CoA ligase